MATAASGAGTAVAAAQTNNFMISATATAATTPSGSSKIRGLTASGGPGGNQQAMLLRTQPIVGSNGSYAAQQAAKLGSAMQRITEDLMYHNQGTGASSGLNMS